MKSAELYDRDFYRWTVQNAELLRAGRASEADLEHMPSLRGYLAEKLTMAHERAVILASCETLLPMEDFPSTCPYPLDALLDAEFLP